MTTQFEIDCALMAGSAYQSTTNSINQFPVPSGWTEVPGSHQVKPSSFEATTFTNGNQLVISFAGTAQGVDWLANSGLATGLGADQLKDAALYYLQVRKANPTATISFTGHSLGGGLAALMGVFFNQQAVTFDQAPFDASIKNWDVHGQLISYLNGKGYSNIQLQELVPDLLSFMPGTNAPRVANVTGLYVQGEVLQGFPLNTIGTQTPLEQGASLTTAPTDLHSQALLSTFVLNDAFRQITSKLPDLLKMVFDSNLYQKGTGTAKENFIERLVRHQVGVSGSGAVAADNMLNRFTIDLQKVAQAGGFSLTNEMVSKTLVAFAMQKYYEEPATAPSNTQTLFSDVSGGIKFDRTVVASSLTQAKGYNLYFQTYLNTLAADEQTLIKTLLPAATDWFVQAGANAMTATEGVQKAFMLGGLGNDVLTGGTLADLLMGNAGADTLTGGGGNDVLIGGSGLDIYIVGNGKDTIRDNTDGEGLVRTEAGVTLSGGKAAGKSNTWVGAQGETYTFLPTQAAQLGTLVISNLGAGNEVKIEKFDLALAQGGVGYLGIKLDNTSKLVIKESTGGNPFADFNFNAAAVTGTSAIVEGTGTAYTLFLNVAAKANETITLALSSLADKFKAILGDSIVDANGAVITLAEGQTQVSFALVQQGDVSEDASMNLSASYAGANGNATSNAWGVNLTDAGPVSQTANGDQRAKLIGIETQLNITADKPNYNTYAWGETSWGPDGTLINGVAELDFSDVVKGTAGNDKIAGLGGNDALDGGAGNDEIDGGSGDDLIGGGAGSDNIKGGDGADYINSSATLNVSQRLKPGDSWSPPAGQVVLSQGALWGIYKDTLPSGDPVTIWSGSDSPAGTESDVVDAGAGNDWVIASGGDDRVQGGLGDDQIDGMGGDDVLEGGDGKDSINGDGLIKAGFMNSVEAQYHGADFVDGGAGDDTLTGGGGNDVIYGGADNDKLWGDVGGKTSDADYVDLAYHGSDYLDGEDGNDYMEGGGKDDTLYGGAGNDNMWGDTSADNVDTPAANALIWGNDYLDGEAGDDSMVGGGGDDTLYGGAGSDSLWGDQSNAALAGALNGNDYLDGGDGNDYLVGGGKDDILYGGAGDDTLIGDDELTKVAAEFQGADYLDGGDGNDHLAGGGGDDILLGGAGNDVLDGGSGADYMEGGAGEDTYVVDNEGDVIFEADSAPPPAAGVAATNFVPAAHMGATATPSIDNVESSVSYTLSANLENLTLTGTAAINGSGNSLDNVITGNSAANVLAGGAGNDVYVVDNVADTVIEAADEGNDTVSSSVSFTLADNVEQLEATGTAAINLTGNAIDNGLFGNAGNNILTGGAGNDYLVGDAGNDVYAFNRGDGQDSIDNTDFLSDSARPELLAATDTLRFGAGITDSDVLGFRSGDNMFLKVKGSTDQVAVLGYYGADVVAGSVTSDHKLDRVEFANGVVWDQAMIQTVVDRAANNHAPTVAGGLPTLQARAGNAFTYTVPAGTITDPDAWDSVNYSVKMPDGSAVPAWLSFDAASRTISGTPDVANVGNLQFVLWGTDNYGAAAGTVVTLAIQANHAPVLSMPLPDQVLSRDAAFAFTVSSTTFVDPDEGDTLTYSATLADGSALPSWLSFNAVTRSFSGTPTELGTTSVRIVANDTASLMASDVFDFVVQIPEILGTPGPDVLNGGADNDTIRGLDGDDVLYGGTGNDVLYGGAGNDLLDGGVGGDTMYGGLGDDGYVVDDAGDVIIEAAGEGVDTVVRSFDSAAVLADNVENLTLTGAVLLGNGNELGNAIVGNDADNILRGLIGNDTLTGGGGNDLLDGGTGADTMLGGQGDDVFMVDQADDVVLENADEGLDTVLASVSYTLSDNVESLILDSTSADSTGTGNAQANRLTGNDYDNRLDGGLGADILEGGLGNDTYLVDNAADQVLEQIDGGGVDQVISSSVDYTLAANVENLTLAEGSAALRGTGNDLANTLMGNGADNTLNGGAGNDQLDGGLGADQMTGGTGNDTYYVDNVGDTTTENLGAGVDSVFSSVDHTLSDYVENLTLVATPNTQTWAYNALTGTGNALNNVLTGDASNDTLYGLDGNDTLYAASNRFNQWTDEVDVLVGGAGDDVYWVDSANDQVVEAVAGGNDTVHSYSRYTELSANVENLVIEGSYQGDYWQVLWRNYEGVGNALDNSMQGNDASNVLSGLDGSDHIDGAAGDDTLYGGDGNDILFGGADAINDGAEGHVVLASNADFIDGGAGDDVIDGGAGNDILLGGDGADVLYGGDDGLSVPRADQYDWRTGSYIPVGPLQLSNDDFLDGGAGIDTLRGGTGDDTYVVDGVATVNPQGREVALDLCDDQHRFGMDGAPGYLWTTDRVLELAGQGIDTVNSTASVNLVGQDIEIVNLLDGGPVADLDAYTGDGSQTLNGNAGNNTLDGGSGADVMAGGVGDDTYYVDNIDDVVTELVNAGVDTVRSTMDGYALGSELENLVLEGEAVTGSGNDLDNALIGNAMDNQLSGGAGDDRLAGWHGNDTLLGGAGLDTYVFARADGQDIVVDTEGTGRLHFSEGISLADLDFVRSGADLIVYLYQDGIKTQDQITLQGWVNAPQRINTIEFCDGPTVALDESLSMHAPVAEHDAAQVTEDVNPQVSGNVLTNDHDADVGDVLSVAQPGTFVGAYGSLKLGADGSYTYSLNNADITVQSLALGQTVFDTFAYTAQDNAAVPGTANAELVVSVLGTNDAPVLDAPLPDRAVAAGQALSFAVPDGTFFDIDQGDVLAYSAQVVDAQGGLQALPSWLTFNASTGTFSGTPKAAGDITLRVSAHDLAGADSFDDFTLSITTADKAGKGNEGLGNGQDAPPPGHDTNWNDGPGTSPGNPGRRGGGHVSNGNGKLAAEFWDGATALVSTASFVLPANLNILVLNGTGAISGTGNALDNWLLGNVSNNLLDGGAGNDLLQGREGNDQLTDLAGRNLLDGGAGADVLTDGDGASMLFGGKGNDTLILGKGADLIGFNRGDGADVVNAGGDGLLDDIVSLGAGIRYADLSLSRKGNDLVLNLGAGESITFNKWYAGSANRSVDRLQVMTTGGDYDAASTDKTRNRQVEVFDFAKLVRQFDAAQTGKGANASSWSVMNSLLDAHLAGSNTQALGGDLAFQYASNGSFAGIGLGAAQACVAAGTDWQTLRPRGELENGALRLVA